MLPTTMTDALAGLHAVAVGAPTIDIDATLGVQMALFILLWIFLSAVVFKPYLTAHRDRVQRTEGERSKATMAATRADELLSEYETSLARARAEATTTRASMVEEAKREAERLVASAREDSQRHIEQARAELEADLAAVRGEVEPRAQLLSDAITRKILA